MSLTFNFMGYICQLKPNVKPFVKNLSQNTKPFDVGIQMSVIVNV